MIFDLGKHLKTKNELQSLWLRNAARIKAGGWLLGLSVLGQILAIVVLIFVARALSKDDFGRYQAALSILGLCSFFSFSGLRNAVIQSVARGFFGTYFAAATFSFLGSIVGAVVLLTLGVFSYYHDNTTLAWSLWLGGVCFPFSQGLLLWQAYHIGREQHRRVALHQGVALVIAYSSILIAVALDLPFYVFVAAFFGVQGLNNLRLHLNLFRQENGRATREEGILKYGLEVSAYEVLNLVGNHIDKLLLFFFISPASLAVYAVASRIPELMKSNLQSAREALLPALSKKQHYTSDLNRKLNFLILATCLFLVAFSALFVPWFLPWVFSDKYTEAVEICQLLLLSVCVGSYASTKYMYILSRQDAASVRGINIYTNAIRILLSLLLVPQFELYGAVAATICYRGATSAMVLVYLTKHRANQ